MTLSKKLIQRGQVWELLFGGSALALTTDWIKGGAWLIGN